jgi:hypothetical protein
MDEPMKHLPSLPILTDTEIRTLRQARARAQSKWTNGGRIRSKAPAPITLRLKDRPVQ